MKLLDAVKNVTIDDKDILKRILSSLQDRVEDIENKEPFNYSDSYYNKWLEKLEELNSIVEDLEEILRIKRRVERQKLLNRVKINISYYQFQYGGLKRLVI